MVLIMSPAKHYEAMADNTTSSTVNRTPESTRKLEGIVRAVDQGNFTTLLDSPTTTESLLESCSDKIAIIPWKTVPKHYGGADIGEKDFVVSLESRMVALPKSKSFKIKNPRAKALYERIVDDGEFAFRYLGFQSVKLAKRTETQFFIEIYESLESLVPLLVLKFVHTLVEDDENAYLSQQQGGFFYESLRQPSFETLAPQVVHNIMRHHGGLFRRKEITRCLGAYLRSVYHSKSNYAAMLDAVICSADIMASQQDTSQVDIASAFLEVGKYLEVMGQYATSADVYERAAGLSSGHHLEAKSWMATGLALKRDAKYTKAEEAHYRALHTKVVLDGRKLLLNNEMTRAIVLNTLHLYGYMALFERPEERPWNDQDKMEFALTTLFHAAGFDAGEGNDTRFHGVEKRNEAFKPQFLTKQGAQLALLVAILKTSFSGYRKHLLNCFVPEAWFLMPANRSAYSQKDFEQYSREQALGELQSAGSTDQFLRCKSCGAMEKANNRFKCCSCKLVHYCSKECQKEHWKNGGHKENCAWQKNKARVGGKKK